MRQNKMHYYITGRRVSPMDFWDEEDGRDNGEEQWQERARRLQIRRWRKISRDMQGFGI